VSSKLIAFESPSAVHVMVRTLCQKSVLKSCRPSIDEFEWINIED